MAELDDFDQITHAALGAEANALLDKQIERTRLWREEFVIIEDREPTLRELVQKVNQERAPRPQVLAAYGAALYRLSQEDPHG
jgi:hypothetical protein